MQYTIDSEKGILLQIEDNEADAVFSLLEQRRAFVVEPEVPEIPLPEAVMTLPCSCAHSLSVTLRRFAYCTATAARLRAAWLPCGFERSAGIWF